MPTMLGLFALNRFYTRVHMTVLEIVLVILIVFAIAALPHWRSTSWGYGPSGAIGTVAVILLVLLLLGRI